MSFDKIRAASKIALHTVEDDAFVPYGRVLTDICFAQLMDAAKDTEIPASGCKYVASVAQLEKLDFVPALQDAVYGGFDIQVGTCAGHNTQLNGIEFHQGNETIVALTDVILILGKQQDMVGNTYQAKLAEAFYLKKGQAVTLYATSLHYTPCSTSAEGFANICILLKGTNSVLESPSANKLLTKKNKYFITHETQQEKIKQGALIGLLGEIPEIVLP